MSRSISSYAREYADALDRLERARSFAKNFVGGFPATINVSWDLGRACAGYDDVSKAISKLVAEQMPELLQRVVNELDVEVSRAHSCLENAAHLGSRGHMRAGDA